MDSDRISKLKINEKERTPSRRSKKWKALVFFFILAGTALITMVLYQQGLLTPAVTIRAASSAWVYPSQTITEFNASGYVVAQRKAAIASKGTGRIEYLGVVEGSRLKEGDVVARLENDDLKAEKAQAEAQLAAAQADLARAETDLQSTERDWKRFRNLWELRAIAKASYDNAGDQHRKAIAAIESSRASIRALQAAVARSSVLIEYTVIRAPFDGVVLTKEADVGEVVAPFGSSARAKASVVTMADLASLMVETDVAEAFLSKVKAGQTCEIQLDSLPNVRFPGKVNMIVPTADRTRGTVLVKVSFDALDPRILPEMSAKVAFLSRSLSEGDTHPQLAVHRDALVERNGAKGIFRIENDRAVWVPIPSPDFLGDSVIVASIMKGGEQIIMKPPSAIKGGEKVKVAE